jgi:benzoyl-CoA reductase/2-hydroxyglutaryl-CoA dehydratase subunit BcrC/BadD/HgdB
MMNDHTKMWTELGINMPDHDMLMTALPALYQEVYLSQTERPHGMAYFDGLIAELHGQRVQELIEHKQQGGKVFATMCVFVPEEIILACGGVMVGLCGGVDWATNEVEKVLPRNMCALIKSFMGFKLGKVCPYFEVADLVVGETTCDGKKKSFEVLGDYLPVHVMETPQMKNPIDYQLWDSELQRFIQVVENLTGNKISAASLQDGIRRVNNKRQALQRLSAARKANPAPISGKDALLIYQTAFYDDIDRFTAQLNELCDELEQRISASATQKRAADKLRIMVSGTPMAVPNWKIPHLVESAGARIVFDEMCTGERYFQNLVAAPEDKSIAQMVTDITKRSLEIDCACFTPNQTRIEKVIAKTAEYGVDGVIHYALQSCDPFTIEGFRMEKHLKEAGIPIMRLETDYSQEDVGQLQTRIEAFLETLAERKGQ